MSEYYEKLARELVALAREKFEFSYGCGLGMEEAFAAHLEARDDAAVEEAEEFVPPGAEFVDSAPQPELAPEEVADVPFDWDFHRDTWNCVASRFDLPRVRDRANANTDKRKRALRKVLAEYDKPSDFWDEVVAAIEDRGAWAKDRRFPAFDQVLKPDLRARLTEGNYKENGNGAPKGPTSARAPAEDVCKSWLNGEPV